MALTADDDGGGCSARSVDVKVNLVPFIDLMSCLVAFLLVTAAWSSVRQLPASSGGGGGGGADRTRLSLLIARDGLWVGDTLGTVARIAPTGGEPDFGALERALAERRASGVFAGRSDIEVAAEEGVSYGALVSAMDAAVSSGFADVAYADPGALSVRFLR